jgi:hypothetical protein
MEEQEFNESSISDYYLKKRAVDKASLETQSSILSKYEDCFDKESVARMSSEFGSNKIEVYNEPHFVVERRKYLASGICMTERSASATATI